MAQTGLAAVRPPYFAPVLFQVQVQRNLSTGTVEVETEHHNLNMVLHRLSYDIKRAVAVCFDFSAEVYRRLCHVKPSEVSMHHHVLKVPDLSSSVKLLSTTACAYGGFGEVREGVWKQGPLKLKALKTIRAARMLRKEVAIMKNLQHPNIVPFWGVAELEGGGGYGMVSEWIEGWTLHTFIQTHHADSRVLSIRRRFEILGDIASGLEYLHAHFVVHGDLSATNVLINECGRVFICDFGLSRDTSQSVESAIITMLSILSGAVLNPSWNAPELVLDPNPFPTMSSDIYSFGALMFETLSGQRPYGQMTFYKIAHQMEGHKYPERPSSEFLDDNAWMYIIHCFDHNPANRPGASEVRARIFAFLN
ncbi:kinase-like domain-containing protein [Crucibulum laeve]|uniref:Kinase-like domain-containing protein n=1 Tax=Crucibulum laeve TaxID=68775 RepID=A0A5C3M134_9AGAR|nr:kinase-like domain-containing protein [Crucibulum laeve]